MYLVQNLLNPFNNAKDLFLYLLPSTITLALSSGLVLLIDNSKEEIIDKFTYEFTDGSKKDTRNISEYITKKPLTEAEKKTLAKNNNKSVSEINNLYWSYDEVLLAFMDSKTTLILAWDNPDPDAKIWSDTLKYSTIEVAGI